MKGSVRFALEIALCLAPLASGTAQTPSVPAWQRSATKARDIGGFTLGMSIRDAAKLVPIEALGNDNFQAVRDGILYDFEVTPKGRIYRVSSSQSLGQFRVDDVFLRSLAAKLEAKYGAPSSRTDSSFGWSLIEQVRRTNGSILPFETMWASAYVTNDRDGVSIEIKIIDFRVLWHDEEELNRQPRQRGAAAVTF